MKLPTTAASALPLPLLLAALLPHTTTATIAGTLINNCAYPIYAKTTRGGGYDSHELARVAPHGGTYHAAVHAHANGAGVTLKAQRQPDPAWPDVYQAEYTQSDTPYTRDGHRDWAWYDLSTVDGSPFADEWRRLEVRGSRGRKAKCPVLECAPGSGACEWPVPESGVMGDCRAGRRAEVVVTLCRSNVTTTTTTTAAAGADDG